jgi:protein-S-isoprenylcysteine O-methyltransferase Ste14
MVPAGEIWRRIVPPLATTFVVFFLLVRYHVRHAEPAEPPPPRFPWPAFIRYLAATAAAGYGMFLAIVLVFHVWLARDHAAFRSAVAGGAALLAIVLPLFVLAGWFARRRSAKA